MIDNHNFLTMWMYLLKNNRNPTSILLKDYRNPNNVLPTYNFNFGNHNSDAARENTPIYVRY